MNLGSDELTTSKQDTIEHVEISRATRCNLFTRITPRVRSNLSKNNNEINESTRDTRFVPEVQLTIKVAYVSVEVPTKGRVSLDPKPHRTITKMVTPENT
jgi:hypothetical protein